MLRKYIQLGLRLMVLLLLHYWTLLLNNTPYTSYTLDHHDLATAAARP